MTFLDFIFSSQNYFFSGCLALASFFIVIEIISALMGGVIDGFADNLLPESLVDFDPDPSAAADFTGLFQWMLLGRVPIIIWLVVFLMGLAMTGFMLQAIAYSAFGYLIYAWLAVPIAFVQNLCVVRLVVGWLAKILPKDESYSISELDFVGRKARIFLKPSTPDLPLFAKFTDQHGTEHRVSIELKEGQNILDGQEVVLHERLPTGNFHAVSVEEFNSTYLNN